MSDKTIIIGGGVSGITTALTLELLGFDTTILAAKTAREIDNKNNHPEFASLFPSASVLPHSVYSNRLKDLFQLSQSTFYELRKQVFPGLTTHRHFEIFEFETTEPDYCNWLMNWTPIDEMEEEAVPRRPQSPQLYGWAFDCIFADWSLYYPALTGLYEDIGGNIEIKKLEADDIENLPADIVINCSGTGGPELFDDPVEEHLLLRGHLLHDANRPLVTNAGNEIISYNYTPLPSVYADSEGRACDVYCYPRKDGWILGGSRQAGLLNTKQWGELKAETEDLNGITFPSPIIDLNNEILDFTYGLSLDRSDELSIAVGYRYIRSRDNGLRLEKENYRNKEVYHNYGHGGAGVTLSWGCALHIAREITSGALPELKTTFLDKMDKLAF